MAKVFAVVSQKGGVGKTTTSVNLSTAFAIVGRSTLLIDFDPQGNSSSGLGLSRKDRLINVYDVLVNGEDMRRSVVNTEIQNLFVVPSTIDLAAAELELAHVDKREFVLKRCLSVVRQDYQYVFIDCPPSLGLITVNALAAADALIIPMQCEFFSMEGLSHLLKTVYLVKKNINPSLIVEGIILTMYDRRNNLSEQVEENVRKYLKEHIYRTVIPRNVRLSEAPSHGKPAIIYDFKCPGSQAYLYLAREILVQQKSAKVQLA